MPDGLLNATEIQAVVEFACELYGRPIEDGFECQATMLGLRGAASLRPWLEDETNDVEELARLDYEPEFGEDWRDEWLRRVDETSVLLVGRFGFQWQAVFLDRLAKARQDAMVH